MITFDRFVASLGVAAKAYTPEELRQLHIEVQKLARLVLKVYRREHEPKRSPQARLDQPYPDRTVETE